MDTPFDDRMKYLEASRRIRETFARHQLETVLLWAFAAEELAGLPDDGIEDFVYSVRDAVGTVEPALEPAMDELRNVPGASLRGDLVKAFKKIRAIAQDIATGKPTAMFRPALWIYVPARYEDDREGRPRRRMRGRLADGLVWMALKLFSEVPRSLIRPCGFAACSRVYVAVKNQKFCLHHQEEARRAAHRKAERAFRARAKKKRSPR